MRAPLSAPKVRVASGYPRTITFKGPRGSKKTLKKVSRTKIK